MSKTELERYSKRFIVLGVILVLLGILNWFRGAPENSWGVISSVGCVLVGLMQFLLAHRLHKKAQRLPG
ncbi:MAG: hypothetical protein QOE46_1035 [Acidobacteriota bacterium]|jgi:hypothetical protein|nr:hypothetical protein [Acidobacteriota bacterium]